MSLIAKIQNDSKSSNNYALRIISKRIIDLLEKWNENICGSDYFVFRLTFRLNVNLYRSGVNLTKEQFDKLDEIMKMLDNPKQ